MIDQRVSPTVQNEDVGWSRNLSKKLEWLEIRPDNEIGKERMKVYFVQDVSVMNEIWLEKYMMSHGLPFETVTDCTVNRF